jgi:hypothetical protein
VRAHHKRNLWFGEPDFSCRFIGHIKRDRGWLPFHPLLVASRPALDLLIGAKHLFVSAMGWQLPLLPPQPEF